MSSQNNFHFFDFYFDSAASVCESIRVTKTKEDTMTLLDHLPALDRNRVSTYRAVLSRIEAGHFGSERFKITKHDTLENVTATVNEFVSHLSDEPNTVYGLVIEDFTEDTFAPGDVHRIRFSRDEVVASAA